MNRHGFEIFGWTGLSRSRRSQATAARRSGSRSLLPSLLRLEDRALLSTLIVVNNPTDAAVANEIDLRQAIDEANSDGTANSIEFDPGVFATPQTITLTQGVLQLSDTSGTQTITGPSAGVTISGNASGGVFRVVSNVTASFSGLTITDGKDLAGGGLYISGTATLTDCTISGNSAFNGGGVYSRGTANLTDCTMTGNSAFAGGGLTSFGTASLTACTVSGNSASNNGGGLYNDPTLGGSLTLADTIVAGNMASVTGPDASGPFVSEGGNLIGETNASSGWADSDLTGTVAIPLDADLAPLGNYGGPTETMALLPGSPAIHSGVAASGDTADQRGVARGGLTPDIGAFQSQGFTLALVSGGSPQSASIDSSFANPLSVQVTADAPLEPVAGGLIRFTPPTTGASAVLSSATDAINSSGLASITAVANSTIGSYTIAASTTGATAPADFQLTNTMATPTVTVADASGVYKGSPFAATATVTGTSGIAGASLDGVTPTVLYYDGSSATGASSMTAPSVPGTYTVTATYPATGDYLASQTASATFQIIKAMPILSVADAGGVYNGSPFAAKVTVTGISGVAGSSLDGVSPTLTYYAGNTATGAPLSAAPSAAGTYTVLANYAGSPDYQQAPPAVAFFSIDPDTATVSVTASSSSAVYGQSVTFTATVTAPGSTPLTGTVTFFDGATEIGAAPLGTAGTATLTISNLGLGGNSITARYSGDADALGAALGQSATVSVAQGKSDVTLVSVPFKHKKKVVSLSLNARITPEAPGSGVPTGTVIFELLQKSKKAKPKVLGTVGLSGGTATLLVKPATVKNKTLEVIYSGDANFQASSVTTKA